MSLAEIPTSITIGQQDLSFRSIHKNFSQTEIGKKLNDKTRWERYQIKGDDPENTLPNQDWIKIIGQDANNLGHGLMTYRFSRLFIDHLNDSSNPNSEFKLDKRDQEIILFTSISHDWPEGVTEKGDASFELKTEEDELQELSLIEGIITDFLGKDSLPIARQVKNVLGDPTSRLGMVFNAIERMGYCQTGFKAWQKRENFGEKITPKLTLLSNNVLLNNIPRMINYSLDYPPINSFLRNRQNIISNGFSNMPNSIFDLYTEKVDLPKINRSKFKDASERWNSWIKPRCQIVVVK